MLSVTDTGCRRRWTDEEELRIVEESLGVRGRVADTARRHDIGRTLLVRWRREYREGRLVAATEDCPRFTALAISGAKLALAARATLRRGPCLASPADRRTPTRPGGRRKLQTQRSRAPA
ncbi:transposase [Nioella halotolerans]|uniref:transposase n=1 Tax=Nioella halotolerans TaxID=2303578 RepID=UPI003F65BCB6